MCFERECKAFVAVNKCRLKAEHCRAQMAAKADKFGATSCDKCRQTRCCRLLRLVSTAAASRSFRKCGRGWCLTKTMTDFDFRKPHGMQFD